MAQEQKSALSVLESALKYMKQKGWTRGTLENYAGQVCSVGAIRKVCDRESKAYGTAFKHLTKAVVKVTKGQESSIIAFNDRCGRTEKEVHAAFQTAIKALKKKRQADQRYRNNKESSK